jgi:hypothetical protein
MDNEFSTGECVMVTFYGKDVIGEAGDYDKEQDLLWVDLKLMDSHPPDHIVYTGFKLSECRKITEAEAFKHKLQDRGVGVYD